MVVLVIWESNNAGADRLARFFEISFLTGMGGWGLEGERAEMWWRFLARGKPPMEEVRAWVHCALENREDSLREEH
jgi:hypothetical protein